MKIALASPDILWEDKIGNMKICESLVRRAVLKKADLVVFPEMTLTGFSMNIKLIAERKENSATQAFFSELARRYRLTVVFGVVWKHGKKASNNLVCLDRKGREKAIYAKIHPFSLAGEAKFYLKGSHLAPCAINGVRFGFSICYDLRFPEIFSALTSKTQVFVNIASWPQKRIDHWYAILRARAIENQVFMIGVNRTGKDGHGICYKKSSAVFGADGKIMKSVHRAKDLDVYVLDFKKQKEFRRKYPFIKDRRTYLYRSFYR